MHLLAATPGTIDDGKEPVDLGQSPADIVFVSAADTELAALSEARAEMPSPPGLRLANLTHLQHPMSADLHLDQCATRSRLVIARVLGGVGYWKYGAEQYAARCHDAGVALALLPGDDKPDAQLRGLSTVSDEDYDALWAYLVEGGPENAHNFLAYAQAMLDHGPKPPSASQLLRAGVYWPGAGIAGADGPAGAKQRADGQRLHCEVDEVERRARVGGVDVEARRQRDQIEARAVELLSGLPDYQLLTTIPGIGPINAMTILAEAGDLRRFRHHRQFLKFCGMDLVTVQSGMFRGHSRISKYGNARLRRTLWMAGQTAVLKRTNSFRDKFERYISKDRHNAHLRRKAYTAIAAKMARTVHAVVNHGEPYRPFFEGVSSGGRTSL